MSLFVRLINILLMPIRAIMLFFSRLLPGLKRVTSISVPARLAWFSFLALLITGITVLIHFRLMSERYTDWPDWFTDWRLILLVIACIVFVPACIYFAVELLMKGDISKYPDIDDAWKAGMQALRDQGTDLTTTPVFLVIGAGSENFSSQFHAAAHLSALVDGVSCGPRPIQWFADTDYIFLHVSGASSLSKLAKNRLSVGSPASGGGGKSQPAYMQTIRGDAAGAPSVAAGPSRAGVSPATTPARPAPANLMRTLVPGGSDLRGEPAPVRAEITQHELDTYADRLEYVCQLIRRNRYPVCSINGVVTLLPFESVENFHDQAQLALHQDLITISNQTGMRFPVTTLITEIENEVGFKELMRRFSREETERGRLGSRYGNGDTDVWTPVTATRARHLAKSACRNIEDNIRQFFGREDALQRPGNGKLFTLLSKIRGAFGHRIETLCSNGLIESSAMVVGCYFVAIGNAPDQHGFLESVVREKVIGNRGKLAWNSKTIKENQGYTILSSLFALVALLSVAALGFMMIKDFFIN
jgi:IcmF-related N-terminal domain